MSRTTDSTRLLDTCGCCEAGLKEPSHLNPPGLPAINYRIGTHPAFLERMRLRIFQWELLTCAECGRRFAGQERLTAIREHIRQAHSKITESEVETAVVPVRPLDGLTTRVADDPAIALMDAWSVVADVLSFYQERIANEGFLRTATERRSILELAGAIGYELNPGVAAETYVVFTVDDAKGSPPTASVPTGTQIQSVPAKQGELPQTFETSEDFVARVTWNDMRPRMKEPQILSVNSTDIYLEGAETALKEGDLVLLIIPDPTDSPMTITRRIIKVEPDAEAGHTRIEVTTDVGQSVTSQEGSLPQAAQDPAPQPDGQISLPLATDPTAALDTTQQPLDLTEDNVKAYVFGTTWKEIDLQAFLTLHTWAENDVLAYVGKLRACQFQSENQQIFAFRERLGFFGHNAPLYCGVPVPEKVNRVSVYPVNWDDVGNESCGTTSGKGRISIWRNPNIDDAPLYSETGPDVYLERNVSGILEDSWVVFRSAVLGLNVYQVERADDTSIAAFALMGKVTGLKLKPPSGADAVEKDDFKVRETTVYVMSEELGLAAKPITASLTKGDEQLWLDTMVFGLQEGQAVSIAGEEVGTDGYVRQEILLLKGIIHHEGYTELTFAEGLKYSYKRDTVTLNANVVRANHGENVAGETLGNGDGSKQHQRFGLKKPPLTYVSALASTGSQSTLSVRVDGVEWKQGSSLYGLDGNSESYIVRIDNDAKASVIFGDGKCGARLPTGQENIVAAYRSGIGSAGEIGAGSLTLLKTRPPGIRSVTNPFKASGAEDPEKLEDARVNAPLTVLTLNRIVSLQDYEDFARAFAGIGKAQASVVWDGTSERVQITVADANGDAVVPPLDENLLSAINAARDPLREVDVKSFQPLVFFVAAAVLRDDRYLWEDMKADIEAALLKAFSFKKRAFAQPVTAAEVLQVIHSIEGVKAVDLDELFKTTPGAEEPSENRFNTVLDAQPARYDKTLNDVLPAQLLLIHELGITLTEITI